MPLPPRDAVAGDDNLFFAAFPNPGDATGIAHLARTWLAEERLSARPITPERLHVSLFPLGVFKGVPEALVAAACEAARSIGMPPFTVAFNALGSFGGRDPRRPSLVLYGDEGVAGLERLEQRLAAAMGAHSRQGYTPHMTIAYGDRLPARRFIEPITWEVPALVLVHSLVGQGRYIPLARIPLRDESIAIIDSIAYNAGMSTLTIRNLDPALKAKLRVRAAERGRSMEEEARKILGAALVETPAGQQTGADLAAAIKTLFAPLGGLPDLEPMPDEPVRDPPNFSA